MNDFVEIEVLETYWKDCLNWTFKLIDVLRKAKDKDRKITDLELSKKVLSDAKEDLEELKNEILTKLKTINIHLKTARNYKTSIIKLLNSTEINLSRMSKMKTPVFDLFDSIRNKALTKDKLSRYIELVLRHIEENWVSFNQSYGRFLIKLKINNY